MIFINNNMKTFKEFLEELKIPEKLDNILKDMSKKSLGIPRNKMPQIKSDDVLEFLEWLSDFDIDYNKTKISVNKLKPIQKDFNAEKILSMSNKNITFDKPVLISRDNYVLDGNHRFLSIYYKNSNNTITVFLINKDMSDILKLANKFPKTTYKNINEENKNGS